MEEKELLTDEEIVEILKKRIENINPWETNALEYHKGLFDLIHRLQSDLETCSNDLKTCSNIEKQEKETNAELRQEIERLKEENYKLEVIVDHNCDPFPKWQEATIEEIAELQKQVDELKERAKIDLENERNWGKIQTRQAVKDTAKEIFTALYHREEMGFDVIKWFAKEYYGVEVE